MLRAIRLRVSSLALGAVLSWGLFGTLCADEKPARAEPDKAPVLLELFTSEGCSSCPPADRLLMRLVRQGQLDGVPVIGLEFHVDYWNYIGWTDPFSAPQHSQRQEDYAHAIGERAYTPQVVIDGVGEGLGSNEAKLRALVSRASQREKAQLSLTRHENSLAIAVSGSPSIADGSAELWLALTERELITAVLRGENAGQKLPHGPVVRSLRKLGKVDRPSFVKNAELSLDRSWKRENLYAVAFVQRSGSHQILGAIEVPIGR